MFGANVSSELLVPLAFVLPIHFLYRVTDRRTKRRENPTAFRAAVAAKSSGRDSDDSSRHKATYSTPLWRKRGWCVRLSSRNEEDER